MRKLFPMLVVMSATFFLTAGLHARTSDGATPAEEEVCDVLHEGDYTKGLYGLCVAYCEAEARSEKVLANYDRKRSEDDPEMPCLEQPEPPACPCWTDGMLSTVIEGTATNLSCIVDVESEAIFLDFATFGNFEAFSVEPGSCDYMLDPDFSFNGNETILHVSAIDADDEAVCRADIEVLCDVLSGN